MNATKQLAARAGLVVCSVLAVALTGCRTHVVHESTRTVYVPAPPPPPVMQVPSAPVPPPPLVIIAPPALAPQPPPPVVVVTPSAPPPVVVIQAEADFYEPLTPYGRWVVIGDYGRCWVPARVEAGWRPYANGYWERTDAGWYWMSDEPWGWATYHYGRWDYQAEYGWIWVPQTQWAPAWVAWREGGGYVGWAPLRPSVSLNVSIGTAVREPAFESRAFVFVEHRRMLEPVRPKTVVVNNTTIINQTVNITNVKVVNKTVINEGPRPEVIERESGRKLRAVPVQEFRRKEEATVAARERNIPTSRDGRVETPARREIQPVERNVVVPPVVHEAEKPAVIRRELPNYPKPEIKTPAHNGKTPEVEIGRKVTPPAPTVEPPRKPEPVAVPRRELRSVERPVTIVKPTIAPIATPVSDERKREPKIEGTVPVTPPIVELKPKQEAKPEARRESRQPGSIAPTSLPPARQQAVPATEAPAAKRAISPKEQSQAVHPAEASKAQQETRRPVVKDKDQEPRTNSPARPAR